MSLRISHYLEYRRVHLSIRFRSVFCLHPSAYIGSRVASMPRWWRRHANTKSQTMHSLQMQCWHVSRAAAGIRFFLICVRERLKAKNTNKATNNMKNVMKRIWIEWNSIFGSNPSGDFNFAPPFHGIFVAISLDERANTHHQHWHELTAPFSHKPSGQRAEWTAMRLSWELFCANRQSIVSYFWLFCSIWIVRGNIDCSSADWSRHMF